MLLAIEAIPIGSRELGENPQDWDYDSSLPEPDGSWLLARMSVKRDDGSWVEVEMIRPVEYCQAARAEAGRYMMRCDVTISLSFDMLLHKSRIPEFPPKSYTFILDRIQHIVPPR